jgi:PAS domain S-box-containing protein
MCPIPCDESLLNLAAHLAGRPGFDKILCRMVEQTPIGIILVDSEHDVEFANPSAREIMGVVSDELIGKQLSDLFGDDYSQMQLTNTKGLLERIPHEVRFKTKGGKERHIKVEYVGAVEQGSGAYIGFLTDVTDIQQLQTELHRRNTFFHNLIESSVDGIMAADMKGNIILFNSGAQRILGYSKEEAFSQLHTTRLYPEGEARDILRRMRSNDYGGKGLLQRHELIAITKDGRQIPMSISGGIIYDGKEEIATYGIFTDLRGIQKIEADLQQTHKMLLQSEKMAGLGRLAAGVAHEINNPMSGITLYSNLLLERLGEDHPAAEDLHVIINETERCKQIVSDLLEFLEGELSRIWGNAIRLNQVFTNIIVNAIQAMEGRGKLTIITRHRSKRGIVEIVITDTGPGIEKEILSEIFDPFFTTKAQDGGTGLGLSVSYAIVREHKGSIRVESTLGKGTSFTLRFPILQEEALEEVS